MDYFENYPLVDYDGKFLRNLTLRADVAAGIVSKLGVFYPYRVRDGERIDTVAHDYYGDSRYFWLVAASNDFLDPYYDWPLSEADFEAYVRGKYGSLEAAEAEVHHYESPDSRLWMTPESRSLLPPEERVGFDVEKTAWAWEREKNEAKRNIRLLSRKYAKRALQELQTAFSARRAG